MNDDPMTRSQAQALLDVVAYFIILGAVVLVALCAYDGAAWLWDRYALPWLNEREARRVVEDSVDDFHAAREELQHLYDQSKEHDNG